MVEQHDHPATQLVQEAGDVEEPADFPDDDVHNSSADERDSVSDESGSVENF